MARFSKIQWGDGLTVTDQGASVIRVDGGGGGGAPSGPAGGDLTGSYPNPQVAPGVIVNVDVAAAAAIAYSKLALAGSIVNADVAAAAAIGVAKLAAGSNGQVLTTVSGAPAWATPATVSYGTTLPASPVDGQEAILVDSTTNPAYQWRFRYNAGSTSTWKWELVGGPALGRKGSPGNPLNFNNQVGSSGWFYNSAAMAFSVPYSGQYLVGGSARLSNNGAALGICQIAVFTGSALDTGVAQDTTGNYMALSIVPTWTQAATAGTAVGVAVTSGAVGTNKLDTGTAYILPIRVG